MNPFCFRELPLTAPFCNRKKEIQEIVSHSKNRANVVIFSPRRYGKTSLIKRIQERLKKENVIAIYIDFFGVDSIEDVAARLATKLYAFCYKNEGLLKKATRILSMWRFVMRPDPEYGIALSVEPTARKRGGELLEETLSGFGRFIQDVNQSFSIAIGEFQEIVELKESLQIEGIMRSHIQTHGNASYLFVGSRRRILKDMFNERKRPFYRSAINYPLSPLPADEAALFIQVQFKKAGKNCPDRIAKKIVEKVSGYPYYIQRIPYSIFEVSGKNVTEDDYSSGFAKAINEEKLVYETMLQVLSPNQIKLLSALAEQPTDRPYAAEYISFFNLGSIGGIQGAMKKLINLDYIEKDSGIFRAVDPVFGIWLRHLKGGGNHY